jgi:hypothetical protein
MEGFVVERVISELQDMRNLDWAVRKMSPGTPGCFLKAYENVDGQRVYYKLSNYDSYRGIFGHESVNELIASRLLTILGIPHVEYSLIHAMLSIDEKEVETWISASDNFRKNEEEKIAFDTFYTMEKEGNESPLEFAIRYGWERYIYQMFLVDYLIANRDRHGSNIEILKNVVTGEVRLAPLFDQGVSLLFSTYGDEELIREADPMRDYQGNNFIGSRSMRYNLSLIPSGYDLSIRELKEEDKGTLFDQLDQVLTKTHIDKIWDMIWKRWCCYVALCSEK